MNVQNLNEAIHMHKNIVIWGCGKFLEDVFEKIDPNLNVVYICDIDSEKWGKTTYRGGIPCISPEEAINEENVFVLIAIQSKRVWSEISNKLESANIPHCHINEAIKLYQRSWEEIQISKYCRKMENVAEPRDVDRMKFYIPISIPVEACNLKCEYCYIGHTHCFEPQEVIYHSPKFIRYALSRKRLGGTALINFAAVGETLLCAELPAIIHELLEEGHYISLSTNALLTNEIRKIIGFDNEYNARVFFKCSFHYRQLLEKKLLKKFVENINIIKSSGASYTIELVPEDELIPYIEEIKLFSIENFGALPHLTVARDERDEGLPILTKMPEEEYINIWGQFESELFDMKMKNRGKQSAFCFAGERTILFSLESGCFSPCPFHATIGNVYDNISEPIEFSAVGTRCELPYCFNGHSYLAFGLVPGVKVCSYYDMRDKRTRENANWLQPKMAAFFKQRICDNY